MMTEDWHWSQDLDKQIYKKVETSCIMLTWNNLEITKIGLESLMKYTKFDKENIMTIVDNNSFDGTQEYLYSAYNNIDFVFNRNYYGIQTSINMGIRRVPAKYYLIFHNDVRFAPYWREILVNIADEMSEVGIVGPSHTHHIINGYVDWWGHFCWLLKDEVVQDQGLLDEDMYRVTSNDDVSYCKKIGEAGWKTFVTSEVVIHHLTSTTRNKKGRSNLYDEICES